MALFRMALFRMALFRMALLRMALFRIAFWVGALADAAVAAGATTPRDRTAMRTAAKRLVTRMRILLLWGSLGGLGGCVRSIRHAVVRAMAISGHLFRPSPKYQDRGEEERLNLPLLG